MILEVIWLVFLKMVLSQLRIWIQVKCINKFTTLALMIRKREGVIKLWTIKKLIKKLKEEIVFQLEVDQETNSMDTSI